MSLFGYTLSSFGTSAKGAFRRGIARRLRDGNVDVNEKAVEFMGISSGSERRRLAATAVNVDYQIVLRNTSEASSASNLLGASSAALLQKALKDAGMGELSGVSVLVAPFTQAPPPPPSPPSPPFPPPSARGGGSGGMSNEMVIIISVVVCAVGIGGATAACLIVNRLKGAEKELQSASSRGSHWADEDYVGEASPHRITSPRGEADDSKNVEMALLARDEGSSEQVTEQSAKWYLSHAVGTVRSMMKHGGPNCELVGTSRANLCNQASKAHIGASMWWELMRLLEVESMHSELDEIRSIVLSRLSNWEQEKYAYTSEFSFDTVSPEEVISWALYHGVKARDDKRDRLVKEATSFIRSYTSEVAHWAYHGSSRGYWDFDMLGKEGAHYLNGDVASAECTNEANPDCVIERGLHHYRSAINAHALLEVYQASPEDSMHLLRTAMGGLTGVLASVDKDGLHSLAYHSAPRIMRYDDYSGDSAVSWFYMARLSASFVAFDTGLSSWLCFLCDFLHASDVKHAKILQSLPGSSADVLSWTPRDAMQTRTFLSPMRAMVEIRGGSSRIVRVHANLRKCESTLEVIASSSSFQVVVAAWSVTNGKDVVVRRSDAPDAPVCRCSRPVGVLAGKSYCACASHGAGAFQSTNTTKPTSSHVHAKIIVSW